MNPVMNILMQKLQKTNPQGYSMFNQLRQNGGNPNAMLNQVLKKYTPEQKVNLLNQAKNYGVPTEILAKLQNIK